MTAKAALCYHLLKGKVLNIKNVFSLIGYTNCPREISRMIEKPFNVKITRDEKEGESRYGQRVTWVDYKLEVNERNEEGIKKMREYVKKEGFNFDTENGEEIS